MKMMMCFLLLLLICSSSTAQLESCVDSHSALSASLAELKVEMKILQRENEAQAAQLIAIKARSDVTENKVEALKRDGEVKQVAFSAALLASGSGNVGPYDTHTPLVFAHVITNIGNAYNSNTGFFTAPVRGVYHFDFYVGAFGEHTAGVLVKNDGHVVAAAENQSTGYATASNGATLLLEVGDVVSMHLWANNRVYDNQNHHITFSGHLLFTM